MNSTKELFGKRVKELRKKKGYTQEKLAEILDVDYQTISRIETGCYFTSYENLEKLAIALDVSIKDFFDFSLNTNIERERENIISQINKLSLEQLQKLSRFIREFL